MGAVKAQLNNYLLFAGVGTLDDTEYRKAIVDDLINYFGVDRYPDVGLIARMGVGVAKKKQEAADGA